MNDTTARVVNIPTKKENATCAKYNYQQRKKWIDFFQNLSHTKPKNKSRTLMKQLRNKIENWNKGNRFEHRLEQITEDFGDTTSVNEIKELRKFIVDIVPDLRGATFIDEMTYVRYKNELYANTDPHIDYKNVVEERKLISKEDAHRVRTVWVPLHDLYGKQSVLTFTAKKRNRETKSYCQ